MSLAAGTRLGPYEIVAPLGAGGMGEVYRARDGRLGREVAVKVLPHHLSASTEVRARFEREAKAVSSLNHPHICTLFDVGREGELDYLVMELIEGESLAERLKRGALPAPELLRLATQVADALDRAHRAGIVHRDLKPANVMVSRSGAKLMDFGLSRVTDVHGPVGGAREGLTQSPTIARGLTAEGTLLGTFQYMSPEQLEGREADARSDLWALGCVLYEMATGRRAFEGRSQASLIAAILEREPVPLGEPAATSASSAFGGPPIGLERLIRNCLAKDPDERIQTAHDVKLQLQAIAEGASYSTTATAPSGVLPAQAAALRRAGSRLPWAIAAAGLLTAVGTFLWLGPRAGRDAPVFRFQLDGPPGVELFWPRVSPNGRHLVFLGSDSTNVGRAFVRRVDQVEVVPIPGTVGIQRPYWSPDGHEIAFVANERLMRAPIGGGSPVVVCAARGAADLSWGSKGMILLDGQNTDSLRVVPASGGELRPAARVDRAAGEIGSAWPCFLPDGEHFLFIGTTAERARGNIRLGRLGTLDSRLLGISEGRVEYGPGDWVLFVRGGALLAQKLDLRAGKLTGEPVTLADAVRMGGSQGHFSVSPAGVLAYGRAAVTSDRWFRESDRSGALKGQPLARGAVSSPRISPDHGRLLYLRNSPGSNESGDVYVLDLARGTDTRLTFGPAEAVTPIWSHDGSRFACVLRSSAESSRVLLGPADGAGLTVSIPLGSDGAALLEWSARNRLLAQSQGLTSSFLLPTEEGARSPDTLSSGPQGMVQCAVSPDGRWLAGVSGSFPNVQVFVQNLAGPPGRWQITSAGGFWPRWTRGGRELVYENFTRQLLAVELDLSAGFRAGNPKILFTLPTASSSAEVAAWTVDAQGERYWVLVEGPGPPGGDVEVVTDFSTLVAPAAKRR